MVKTSTRPVTSLIWWLWLPLLIAFLIGLVQPANSDPKIPATGIFAGLQATPYWAALTASGGVSPYRWRVVAGNLPVGLQLNTVTGQIVGTPNEAGDFSFTVEVADANTSNSRRSRREISLRVAKSEPAGNGMGPLRISSTNHRYFQNRDGKIVYLTGSHTWTDFQDMSPAPRGRSIGDLKGYSGYLDFLRQHHHNFTRLWIVEHAWDGDDLSVYGPLPYRRTGPGLALDGKPKFQLEQFNKVYFDRLRERVADAEARGIYVSVMLFDDWSTENAGAWKGHPFNKENNVNGIDGDLDKKGLGLMCHTMNIPAIVALQEAYVRKIIDTVNNFDNVIYEVANETDASTAWQAHFIDFVRKYEATEPKQHLVGTTAGDSAHTNVTNQWLMTSTADWIAPRNDGDFLGLVSGPPAADGHKVVIVDTDHLPRDTFDGASWVWKSFTRGLNPIFMDSLDLASKQDEAARSAMGQTLLYANRMDLAHMTPRGDLASSGYCLADPGRQYLIYVPQGTEVTVNLSSDRRMYTPEWFNPGTQEIAAGADVVGGRRVSLHAPSKAYVVLYLVAKGPRT